MEEAGSKVNHRRKKVDRHPGIMHCDLAALPRELCYQVRTQKEIVEKGHTSPARSAMQTPMTHLAPTATHLPNMEPPRF